MNALAALDAKFQKFLEGKIDFTGQKLVERTTIFVLSLATIVSFLSGYVAQDLRLSLGVFGVFLGVLLLAFVPNWPYLNAHPVRWRPAVPKVPVKGIRVPCYVYFGVTAVKRVE